MSPLLLPAALPLRGAACARPADGGGDHPPHARAQEEHQLRALGRARAPEREDRRARAPGRRARRREPGRARLRGALPAGGAVTSDAAGAATIDRRRRKLDAGATDAPTPRAAADAAPPLSRPAS